MATPSAPTTAQIVASLGTNSQEQAWSRNLIYGQLRRSLWNIISGGLAGGKPIQTHGMFKDLRGQTANITVEAPLGGDGRQGSGQSRSGYGENIKRKVFQVTLGNHWHGVSQNNITADQTVMGYGSFDLNVREKLKPWFAQKKSFFTEAEIIRCCATNAARLRIFGSSKTSIADLTGADVLTQNHFRKIADKLSENQAQPFAVAKRSGQEILKYLTIAPNRALADLHDSNTWQTLMGNSGLRGAENPLFTGEMVEWMGTAIVPWTFQNDTADGPQGSLAAPEAFLGETITAGTAAFTVKGGGNTTAAALTDRLYFQFFPGAQYKAFEQEKIAQETSATKYLLGRDLTTGKFFFISYTTTDGNTITGVKRLGSTTAGTGAKVLGSIDWDSPGVWANKLLDTALANITVGSPMWPCNAKGQCYVHSYAMGTEALTQGWGAVGGVAMGRRTINNDDDHQRFKEIGFEEQYGINGVQDANGLFSGLLQITSAWNPDGAPTNIT